jgi:recombinational DNA repair ATPase RecF
MRKRIDAPPLLAIDDFGIQLDAQRHNQLKEQIAHFGQVFLTSPHPISPLTESIPFQAFHVQQGHIT